MNQATSIERLTPFTYAGKAYHLRPGPYDGRSLCLHRLMDTLDADPIVQFVHEFGDRWTIQARVDGEVKRIGTLHQALSGDWWFENTGAMPHCFTRSVGPTLPAVEALVQLSARLIEQGYARERA